MDTPERIDLAILGAVPDEIVPLIQLLAACRTLRIGGETFHVGRLAGLRVTMGATGLGKANAAMMIAAVIERLDVREVWNVGCAGAFADGPLRVGDVLVADLEIAGDEGVLTGGGMLPSQLMGIPVLTRQSIKYYDRFPLPYTPMFEIARQATPEGWYEMTPDGRMVRPASNASSSPPALDQSDAGIVSANERPEGSFRLVHGPSLTVSMVSGDAEVASARFRHYGGLAENMEGSAIAQACLRFGVPALECRGISNMAGNRLKKDWRLAQAMRHCHALVKNWLEVVAAGMDSVDKEGLTRE